MKYFLLAILFACQVAIAAPDIRITSMVGQCECVMRGGVCIVENRATLSTNKVFVPGYGAISAEDFNYIKLAGKQMCVRVKEECEKNFDGARCRAARTRFRQTWDGVCIYPPQPE